MKTIIALLCAVSCAAVLVGGCSTAGPDPDDVLWWEIDRWYDLGSEGRGADAERVEHTSWGGIKAMFW